MNPDQLARLDEQRLLLAARTNTGDPNVVALGQALMTLTNEYARAIAVATVPSTTRKRPRSVCRLRSRMNSSRR